MKKSIKLSALFLLLGVGAFAGTEKKETAKVKAATTQQVSFEGSKDVSLNISAASGSMVKFYDQSKNLLLSDRLTGKVNGTKSYNLGSLEDGTYEVSISANHQETTKKVVVYDDNDQKGFFIVQ